MSHERTVDVLGRPYRAETLELADDEEGAVVATLVHRPSRGPRGKAVLHVHGFADYFFQTPAADYWVARGYDFYALDLRKYGRSLREHQTPNFVTDLSAYYEELDEAYRLITERDGHDHVVVTAHSTGGLVTPLWVHDRRAGRGGAGAQLPLARPAGQPAAADRRHQGDRPDRRAPALPRRSPATCPASTPAACTTRTTASGTSTWPGSRSSPGRCTPAGCAPYAGGTRGRTGVSTSRPRCWCSRPRASGHPKEYDESCSRTDIVLDVELIRKWAHKLADHVTLVRVEGALHDVTLSAEPVRTRVFEEITRWMDAYVA